MSKNNMRWRGFMCQSPASTAVGCFPADVRAVVVPRKSNDRSSMVVDNIINKNNNSDSDKLLHGRRIHKNVKYSRLNSKETEILLPLSGTNLNKSYHHHRHHQQHHHHHQPSDVHQKHQKPKNLQLNSVGSDDEIFQVVVLRVSLHCQGCAGKVKKHLSRMQGVTSFNIDLETKRVTVKGHVSPIKVLESVSKIKKAEFWNC